ncbi:MAG: hypothetical protein COB69_01220 [Phycisphaera sp.]|nr:MAG: hypothetical protein COB69_01220 [Phycisphaera sp.]
MNIPKINYILTLVMVLLAAPAWCGQPHATDSATDPVTDLTTDVIEAWIDEAQPGSVILLPPGRYNGNLKITKPIILDGNNQAIIDGQGIGTVIEVYVPGVTIRRLTVRGSGSNVTTEPAAIKVMAGQCVIEDNTIEDTLFGIDLSDSPDSIIRRNTIRGMELHLGRRGDGVRLWWSHGCTVEHNTVSLSRDMVFWYSESLNISHNKVADSRYGLHFMYSHNTTLAHNELSNNSVGIYLMYSNTISLLDNHIINNRGASGYGIGLKDCDDIVIERNALLSNRVGIYIDNSPSSMDSTGLIQENMIAFNEIGMLATPNTHNNVVTGNAFIENEEQAATHGRGELTNNVFSHDGRGNFWSDYAGFDRDGNGIGDLPHEPRSLFGKLLAHEPNLRLFIHSPAQKAIEFTARAVPEFLPKPTLLDPSPLAVPPVINSPIKIMKLDRWKIAGLGIALCALGAGGCLAIGREPRLPTTAERKLG